MTGEAGTIVECILLAGLALTEEKSVFTAEDLVVRAWRMFPDRFGLQGYADAYPDSNRVLSKVMGSSRLRKEGLIERMGKKRYRLTLRGVEIASALRSPDVSDRRNPRRAGGLDREVVSLLTRIFESPALEKFRSGEGLNFSDVASLLNISARSTANQFNVQWAASQTALARADDALRGSGLILPGSNLFITREDLDTASSLLVHIEDVFEAELDVIKNRRDW